MRNRLFFNVSNACGVLFLACCVSQCTGKVPAATSSEGDERADAVIYVQGMTWYGWVPRVEDSLASLAGVKRSDVDLKSGKSYVWFNADAAAPTSEELMEAVAKSGFTATKVEFAGDGEGRSPDESFATGRESSDGRDVAAESDSGLEAIEDPLDFKLNDLSGEEYDGTLLKGHVVLLDFWATWCAPCIKAFSSLNKLENDFGEKGLRVVGIALNSGTREDIAEVIGERTLDYPILLGDAGIEKKFDVVGYPTYVLVGPEGKVQAIYVGEVEDLYSLVKDSLISLKAKQES